MGKGKRIERGRKVPGKVKPYEAYIPENAANFAENTFNLKEQLWMENLAQNMPKILSGKNLLELSQTCKGKAAIIVGAGPSISKYNHLKLLKEYALPNPLKQRFNGVLMATDRMLIPMLKEGIIPDFVATTDGDPIISEYYSDTIFDKFFPHIPTKAIFNALTISPKTVEKWRGDIYWFMSVVDDPLDEKNPKSLTKAIYFMTKKMILQSLGNIGGTCFNIAYFLGCDPVALIGMDFSYEDGTPLEKTIYYDAWVKMCNKDMAKVKRCFRRDFNPFFNTYSLSDLMWDSYAAVFSAYAQKARCRTINCSGQGILHPPLFKGIECMHFTDFLQKFSG